MIRSALFPAVVLAMLVAANSPADPIAAAPGAAAPGAAAPTPTASPAAGPQKVEVPGIENVWRVSDRVWSGAEPEGEEAFEALHRLGIRTVISVDGSKPDVEAARKHGLRYIHNYFGYGGVPKDAQEVLARAIRETEGPIFIHCHHGKHRGPAAAAMAWCLESGATAEQREAFLRSAGTDPEYAGLWKDVAEFDAGKVRDANPELVETQKGESLHDAMARLEESWGVVKDAHENMWMVESEKPEDAPTYHALLIWQSFRESDRAHGAKFDAQFRAWMAESADGTKKLHDALVKKDYTAADEAFNAVRSDCRKCHKAYRD